MARRDTPSRWARRTERSGAKRRLAIAGIAVFAVVDVVLIGFALGFFGGGDAAPTASSSSAPAVIASETPTPQPSAPLPAPEATPVLRTLSAVDGQVAWRAERGSCDAQAVIEVTDDGGASWRPTQPSAVGGRQVLWLWAQDDDYAQAVVTTGDDCTVDGIRTFTSGDFWQSNDDALGAAAYLDGSFAMVTPSGVAAPCDAPVQVAEDVAITVLCADGTLQRSTDEGANWATSTVAGAVSFSPTTDGFALAVQGAPSCQGIAVLYLSQQGFDEGTAPAETGLCVSGAVDPAATVLDADDDAVWLWSGAEVGIADAEVLRS